MHIWFLTDDCEMMSYYYTQICQMVPRCLYMQDLHLFCRETAIRGHGVHMQDLHLSHHELAIRTNYFWPWTVSIVGLAALAYICMMTVNIIYNYMSVSEYVELVCRLNNS